MSFTNEDKVDLVVDIAEYLLKNHKPQDKFTFLEVLEGVKTDVEVNSDTFRRFFREHLEMRGLFKWVGGGPRRTPLVFVVPDWSLLEKMSDPGFVSSFLWPHIAPEELMTPAPVVEEELAEPVSPAGESVEDELGQTFSRFIDLLKDLKTIVGSVEMRLVAVEKAVGAISGDIEASWSLSEVQQEVHRKQQDLRTQALVEAVQASAKSVLDATSVLPEKLEKVMATPIRLTEGWENRFSFLVSRFEKVDATREKYFEKVRETLEEAAEAAKKNTATQEIVSEFIRDQNLSTDGGTFRGRRDH